MARGRRRLRAADGAQQPLQVLVAARRSDQQGVEADQADQPMRLVEVVGLLELELGATEHQSQLGLGLARQADGKHELSLAHAAPAGSASTVRPVITGTTLS